MRFPVDLNNKPALRAVKIRDEFPDRILATELVTVQLSIAQNSPELLLARRALFAHITSSFQENRIDPKTALTGAVHV